MQPRFASQLHVASPRRSRLIYECRTAGAEPLAAIRYHSRPDGGTSNWAALEAASDSPNRYTCSMPNRPSPTIPT